ncbi:MAG TPA: YicC family protein [Candidatus Marinimicrobia bacterium]|nr:YicC family protein [Candidatus Neomarinimicrobiota bacterium]
MMISSMTGFGRAVTDTDAGQLSASIRSVNSRYLDVKIRGLNLEPEVEKSIRGLMTKSLIRGTVQITFELGNNSASNKNLTFNKDRFEALDNILKTIAKNYGRELNMGDLMHASDLIADGKNELLDPDKIINVTKEALIQVLDMRQAEGGQIQEDLLRRLKVLKTGLRELEKMNVSFADERKEKLESRLQKLLGNHELDETRLAQEVALLAERADVTEETVRLKSHYDQMDKILTAEGAVGKRFIFLLQEITREVNTVGSKNGSIDVVNQVIAMKDELEKMREQAQNIL